MVYEFDEFRVDVSKRLLIKGEAEHVPLTPKVFDTLLYLVRNVGKVISKDELMREIWTDSVVEENNLNQNISILRRVFGEKPGEQRFIVTIAGHGYRFVPDVRSVSEGYIRPTGVADSEAELKNLPKSAYGSAPADQNKNSTHVGAPIHKRPSALVIASIGLIGLCSVGFYLWQAERTVAPTVRTIAVLPFKPLVVENRNEALELGMADALISKLSTGGEIVVKATELDPPFQFGRTRYTHGRPRPRR